MLAHSATSANGILGPVDALKLRSSMTLFGELAAAGSPYEICLAAFFDGPDPATVAILGGWSG